jgi:hypothetical protein
VNGESDTAGATPGDAAPDTSDGTSGKKLGLDRTDESQDFVDQSKIDFDPDDGLYSGTAVDGTTEIAGPHMQGDTDDNTDTQADEAAPAD